MTRYVETDCTFTHEGHTFESGGACVTDDYVVAYPAANGVLTNWHGEPIGTWHKVARWRVHSFIGTHMHQIEALVDGVWYTGRGFGVGCIYKGKRKAGQKR